MVRASDKELRERGESARERERERERERARQLIVPGVYPEVGVGQILPTDSPFLFRKHKESERGGKRDCTGDHKQMNVICLLSCVLTPQQSTWE